MTEVPVVLSQFQTPILDDLRAKGTFGTDDAQIIKAVFLAWCGENGIKPKKRG